MKLLVSSSSSRRIMWHQSDSESPRGRPMVRAALARSIGQHLPVEAMHQLLDKDRAELNNEIAGDAMVMIETEWRILIGSVFAAHETLWIEPVGVWKHLRIAMSLTNA